MIFAYVFCILCVIYVYFANASNMYVKSSINEKYIFTFDLYLFCLCFTRVLHMIRIVYMFSTCVLHMILIGFTRVLRMFCWFYAYVFAKKLRQIEFFVRTTCRPQGSPARKGTLWAVSKLRFNPFLFVCLFAASLL